MSFQIQLTSQLGINTKHLSKLTQSVIRPLLQLAVKSIEQENIEEGALERISNKYNINQTYLDEWYGAIYRILRLHLRYPTNTYSQIELNHCLEELKLTSDCIEDIHTVIYGPKRLHIMSILSNKTMMYPRVMSFKWRMNITISSSTMSRVLEPHILMEWISSTEECHVFQVSLQTFHQLRQTVAKLLLEILSIENVNITKGILNG